MIRPDLRVELRKLLMERAGLRKAVELAVKIEAMRGDGLRLLQILCQDLLDGLTFVLDLIAGVNIVNRPMQRVRPVKRALDFPYKSRQGGGDDLFIGWDGGRTEDEIHHLVACLLEA